MGGDAFPCTERLSGADYSRVCEEVGSVLKTALVKYGYPLEVSDKEEICRERGKDKPYGDVDVIIALNEGSKRSRIVELVINTIGLDGGEVLRNSSTYSFLTRERFQIDLLFCKEENFDFILAFKSNNDFGALLGHLLTPLKLKWSDIGLTLKLETEHVPGIGTYKDEVFLTNNTSQVCDFLGLPGHSLDGKTRLSTQEVFEVLTKSKVFFSAKYDEKYKIRERRKRRPVSDVFFNLLETCSEDLEGEKQKLYKNDDLEKLFSKCINKEIGYKEYIIKISEYFNKKEEVNKRLIELLDKKVKPKGNPKLNFELLCSWYPGIEQNTVGKILAKVKSKYSGAGKDSFDEWIDNTENEDIRIEVEHCKDSLLNAK